MFYDLQSNENISVQKEESVLAQEAMLDALLRSEEQHNPWRWGSEGQHGGVGSRDGTGASVSGCWGDKSVSMSLWTVSNSRSSRPKV